MSYKSAVSADFGRRRRYVRLRQPFIKIETNVAAVDRDCGFFVCAAAFGPGQEV